MEERMFGYYTGRLLERLPQSVRPFRLKFHSLSASDRIAYIRTRDVLDELVLGTQITIFIVTPMNRWIANVKWAYALFAGPLLNPEPHAATATVFNLCDKRTWLSLRNTTYELHFWTIPIAKIGCVREVSRRFRHQFRDGTVQNRKYSSIERVVIGLNKNRIITLSAH
jgi:hypothetical protein